MAKGISIHSKTCPLGGYKGPSKCCGGKCRHSMNCCCPGGETIDRAYVLETISRLKAEIRHWEGKLFVCKS